MFGDWIPAGVVFDCDGLLVDTEPCWTAAETELFTHRGRSFGSEAKASLIGVAVPDACRALARWFDDGSTPEAIESELLARVEAIVGRDAQATDGAPVLVELVLARVPAAVASNSPRALLDQALACGGFSAALERSVAADEVARPKPAPDLYLAACARLGLAPERCLAFEDSATGVRAARAAGLRTVAVPTLRTADLGGHVSVPSLADPELVAWVGGWPLAAQVSRSRP